MELDRLLTLREENRLRVHKYRVPREIDRTKWDKDRLCGLVVRVSGYRYRGLGFDSRRYQIF